jgi:hypothetical protein
MSTQGQGDVVGRLDDDDLETIAICIKNGQPGRVTPYEIKAMCEELISLRTLLSSDGLWRSLAAKAVANVIWDRSPSPTEGDGNG